MAKSAPVPALPLYHIVSHWQLAKHAEHQGECVHANAHYLSLLIRGHGQCWNGPAVTSFERPVLSLLPSGDRDRVEARGPAEMRWVGFTWPGVRIEAVGSNVLTLISARWRLQTRRFVPVDAASLAKLIERYSALLTASRRPGPVAGLEMQALLFELLSFHLDAGEPTDQDTSQRPAERCRDILHQSASGAVAIGRISRRLGLSPDHLRRVFQQRFGIAPHAYHDRLRLGLARELLSTTDLPVSAVATRVGYSDPLYFSRVFKRMFGVVPSRIGRRLPRNPQ